MSVKTKMTAIANEIRTLSGTSGTMGLDAMASHVHDANTEVSSQSVLIEQIATALQGKAVEGGEQATPVITVGADGLITATAGTKSATKQLAFQPAKTITPSTVSQIAVSSGHYTGGDITVAAVPTQTKNVIPTSSPQYVTPDNGKFLSKVTIEGDINLAAENIKSGVSIFGVSGTLEEGSGSGEIVEYSENEDAIISGTLVNYTNNRITTIRKFAFQSCSTLTSVNFPVCTYIEQNAFFGCVNLTSISFPACMYIGSYAFNKCNLISVSFPACISIAGAFDNCSTLTSVSLPVCTDIINYAFRDCSNLTSINLPACTNIGHNVFGSCVNLTSVSLPVCANIGSRAFEGCSNLTSINLPACTNISYFAFYSCYKLSNLILGTSTVCTLLNSGVFKSTPYTKYSSYFSGKPYIYVPASLIDTYKSATNWVYYSSYFSTIESLVNLITFTIYDTEYQAEEGMTWAEWVESEYNTNDLCVWGNYIASDPYGGAKIIDGNWNTDYNYINITDVIIPNYKYYRDGSMGEF